MKIQEAIDWLKAISATQKESIHKSSLLQRKESIHMAIKALEKQIPKRVDVTGSDDTDFYICPLCKNELETIDSLYSVEEPYCCKCGQMLDWGD